MDLRIASIAISNGMTLLTRNTVDFERVPNLQFEDWTTHYVLGMAMMTSLSMPHDARID